MDANASYPLVPLPPDQGTLVPVTTTVVAESEFEDHAVDLLALLWHCFCLLSFLYWLALMSLRQLQRQLLDWRCQANYWRAQHQRAVEREAVLKQRVRLLQAEIRQWKSRLFGRTTETGAATEAKVTKQTSEQGQGSQPKGTSTDGQDKRKRGQQPGSAGHGRRNHDHLPTTHETCVLPEERRTCPECGEVYEEIPGTVDGDILEVEVRAHRRRYHRTRYRCQCGCSGQPALLTAPPPDKLIPKGNISVSLWTLILKRKFEFFQPLHRVLAELSSDNMRLPAGTVTDGLHKLVPLFEPLYQLLIERNRAAEHWHCDETRWRVFEAVADKVGFTWMLWAFVSEDCVVFVLDPTRSHDVPEKHFGDDAEGIASVDRYIAYKIMAQVKAGKITLAFCWAHVRRDFLTVFTGWAELKDWAWSWLEGIGLLYHHNNQRLAVREDAEQFAQADQQVRAQVEHLRQRCQTELADSQLRQPQRKVLTSLQEHWSGLTVFVDHPEIPMDNNRAERCERGPVVARKNFYGSGAIWSGRLAAMLFSLFQTLQGWNLIAGKWLHAYLSACAAAGGKPPPDPERFLPWNMTEEERTRYGPAQAIPAPDPPTETAA